MAPALKAWRGKAEASTRVFGDFNDANSARTFREDLKAAQVTWPELFEHRRPIWVHDLRATFVTLSLGLALVPKVGVEPTSHC